MLLNSLPNPIASLLSLLLAVSTAVAAPANARVGITSETNGEPVGKPPADTERVLRVGIDIQADELITTRDDDRAHLVFLDGSSLTVGPNSQIKVDRFVYDPNAKTGVIALTVTTGAFRLVGGRISKNTPVTITTPSATIGIRGGIGLFSVESQETTAQFLFGKEMTVSAAGHMQTVLRPGSQIVTRVGGAPGMPVLIPIGGSAQIIEGLEGKPTSRSNPAPDEKAVSSGFSEGNSGKGVAAPADRFRSTSDINQGIDGYILQSRAVATLPNTTTAAAPNPVASTPAPVPPISGGSLPPPPPTPAPPPVADWCRDGGRRFDRDFHHDPRHVHFGRR